MYMRGLADPADYSEFDASNTPADLLPSSSPSIQSSPDYYPTSVQQVYQQSTTSTSANGSAPVTSSTDWLSLLRTGVQTYGIVKQADAAKAIATPYRAPYYPSAYASGNSPFPQLFAPGSTPNGKTLLLIALGVILLLRR